MDFRGMLCTYLDVKETRNILRGMHMPAQGSKKDLVVELMRLSAVHRRLKPRE